MQQQFEKKRLINWLIPGLFAAWNKENTIPYNPKTDSEKATASKYLGYRDTCLDVSSLNESLRQLEIDIRVLQNRFVTLESHSEARSPSIVYDAKSLLDSFKKQEFLFSKSWRSNFRLEAIRFEKLAFAMFADNQHAKFSEQKTLYENDQDLQQILRLAEKLKLSLNDFTKEYWSLLNSPSSVNLINYQSEELKSLSFPDLVGRKEFKLIVAKHVLTEMGIMWGITRPNANGKFLAAIRIASGDKISDSLDKYITEPKLLDKFDGFKGYLNSVENANIKARSPLQDIYDVSDLVNSIFSTLDKLSKALKSTDVQYLNLQYGQLICKSVIDIDALSETSLYPEVDRLAYDIQWLKSRPGQKFKNEFNRSLEVAAGMGKYSLMLKLHSKNDCLIFEFPSGNQILCDLVWSSFLHLMKQLDLEISDATSSGIVRLKWN